jgi:periplasmic divalent cation tolerance protein
MAGDRLRGGVDCGKLALPAARGLRHVPNRPATSRQRPTDRAHGVTGLVAVRITCPADGTAERIAVALVERRLAACAHVEPPIRSLHHWRGAVADVAEVPVTVRTRAALFDAVVAATRALHPYATPSVIALPILAASPDYAAWLEAETAGAA